jgi:hypothetical protein
MQMFDSRRTGTVQPTVEQPNTGEFDVFDVDVHLI